MTVEELLSLFQYTVSDLPRLKWYERELVIERAKEYKINEVGMLMLTSSMGVM